MTEETVKLIAQAGVFFVVETNEHPHHSRSQGSKMVTLGSSDGHNKFPPSQAGHGASWCNSYRESGHNSQDSVYFNVFLTGHNVPVERIEEEKEISTICTDI